MQNHNVIGSNRHLQPTNGSAARSLYMGSYTPKRSLGWMQRASWMRGDERESEYILAHTGPREFDGHPLGGCGSGFGLFPVILQGGPGV